MIDVSVSIKFLSQNCKIDYRQRELSEFEGEITSRSWNINLKLRIVLQIIRSKNIHLFEFP